MIYVADPSNMCAIDWIILYTPGESEYDLILDLSVKSENHPFQYPAKEELILGYTIN